MKKYHGKYGEFDWQKLPKESKEALIKAGFKPEEKEPAKKEVLPRQKKTP